MTTGIRAIVQDFITKHGRVGKAQLCETVGKSERTLDRWLENRIPDAHDAFKLALACGLEEHEALRLAREEALPEAAGKVG
jgi:hypothetical protein